ncbi:MAG: DUF975 family protein [Ruminococcaceae bacterium]|nr:DUF975 family protein [Oscillospiraceae bacterium]
MAITADVTKKTAKAALKGNWVKAIAIGAVLIFSGFIIYIALSFIGTVFPSVVTALITLLITALVFIPLLMGALRSYWRIMWDSSDTLDSVFYYFVSLERYSRVAKLVLALFLKAVGVGILLFIPAIITDLFSKAALYEFFGISAPAWVGNLWIASGFLKAVALVILAAVMLKYYLSFFLVIADEQMDVYEAIHKSTLLSRATAIDFLGLILSFFGWILISLIAIPLIFTLPYFLTSYMVHSRFAVANYNKVVNQMSSVNEHQFSSDDM